MQKPNIVVFFSDQQRWDTLGCYGQTLPVTPNLDRMAKEGVRFENAFTCQPVCGPARASFQTGRYPTELGTFRNGIPLPLDQKTLAHFLGEQGYETGYVGKWHLATDDGRYDFHDAPVPPERRGGYKDFWVASDVLEFTSHGYGGHLYNGDMQRVDFTGYRVDAVTDFALEFLRTRTKDTPFFLFLSHIEPHHQNDRNRYEGPEGSKELFKDYEVPGDLADVDGDWRENFPDYLGCCHSLDANLGRVWSELQRLGLDDTTLVIYTSDHGSHFRTRNRHLTSETKQWSMEYGGGFDDYKRTCHESAVRIPMIISGPGFTGGKVVEELVSLIDLPPTICAAAGAPAADEMHGKPFQQLVAGKPDEWRDEVFMQISESQVGRAVRTERWKYAVKAPGVHGGAQPWAPLFREAFLYDLNRDPFEKNNLVADPAFEPVRRDLRRRLLMQMADAGEKIPTILPPSGGE